LRPAPIAARSRAGRRPPKSSASIQSPESSGRIFAAWAVTVWLTRHWTADQLVDAIAAQAYFGARACGVEQAAETYFGKPVAALATDEMALPAGLLQAPTKYNPACRRDAARGRRDDMLKKLKDAGGLSDAELTAALARPVSAVTVCKTPPQPR
jgi:membrane peptidoglycan carboxypeptidase